MRRDAAVDFNIVHFYDAARPLSERFIDRQTEVAVPPHTRVVVTCAQINQCVGCVRSRVIFDLCTGRNGARRRPSSTVFRSSRPCKARPSELRPGTLHHSKYRQWHASPRPRPISEETDTPTREVGRRCSRHGPALRRRTRPVRKSVSESGAAPIWRRVDGVEAMIQQ